MEYLAVLFALYKLLLLVLASDACRIDFCSWTKNLECQKNEFRCSNGEKCIQRELFCNRHNNCGDNSDERYCNVNSCPQNTKGCGFWSYTCIPKAWVCDGHRDCSSGEDEEKCQSPIMQLSDATPVTEQKLNAVNDLNKWIKSQKNKLSSFEKWGSNVDSLALILYYAAQNFDVLNLDESEMAYELNILLLSRLSSVKLEDIPSTELASYLNAFLVMCVNPRNFHGYDIVQELRNRVDQENDTNPYILLSLCNAGENITQFDKIKLIETFENNHRTFWTDIQAVVVMALSCANNQLSNEVDDEILQEMVLVLKQQQYENGTVINLRMTALVMQALIATETERHPENFDEIKAFEEIIRNQKSDGSFGGLMSTFLVAPILACKSLVDVNSDHCHYTNGDDDSVMENLSRESGPKKRVRYSIWIGNKKDLERNLVLRVPQNMSLYEIMEIAAEIDTQFKFEYSVKNSKPYINAISELSDNPLIGKFWFLYVVQNGEHTLTNKSPADITPNNNDHYVMWYRKGTWID